MKFVILGSKIDNLVNAYLLATSGHQVTVIEDQNIRDIAHDTVSFSDKISTFSINQNNIRSKINKLLYWEKNCEKIDKIAQESKKTFNDLLDAEKITLQNKRDGLLYLYKNKKQFQNKINELKGIKNYQSSYKILTISELKLIFNSNYTKNKICGAILAKDVITIDKKSFIDQLKNICNIKYKVKFEEVTQINNILTNHKKITGINTDKKVFIADHYIVNINQDNINLLKSIDLPTKTRYNYKIKIFTNNKNIINLVSKYNFTDQSNHTIYHNNGNQYKIEIDLSKRNYQSINSGLNWHYFNKISQSNLLDIKDYKNIQFHLTKEQYFDNQLPLISISDKYHNLFLNGGYGNKNYNLSFGGAKRLQKLCVPKK